MDLIFSLPSTTHVFLFLFAVGAISFFIFGSKREHKTSVSLYRKRDYVLNKSETAFFLELQKQLSREYHIFPKMRIADIIETMDGRGYYTQRNKILPKHVDFLICDSQFKPVLAIELNGTSHLREDRKKRDELIIKIFEIVQLPLEIVDVGRNFTQVVQDLTKKIVR